VVSGRGCCLKNPTALEERPAGERLLSRLARGECSAFLNSVDFAWIVGGARWAELAASMFSVGVGASAPWKRGQFVKQRGN
jgi:hypothetical protein